MIEILATALLALGWFLVVRLGFANGRLRRELVLALLRVSTKPLFGREIVAISGGALRPGTIYVTLLGLEDDGLVVSDPALGDQHGRRIYTTTERAAELHRARLGETTTPREAEPEQAVAEERFCECYKPNNFGHNSECPLHTPEDDI